MPSDKIAIISDIHSNLEALIAVIKDISRQEIHRIVCLGDILGYGPNPSECLSLIRKLGVPAVLGNHDEACLDPRLDDLMNEYARAGLDYSRTHLTAPQKKWLQTVPHVIETDDFTAVHASLDEEDFWPYVVDRDFAERHFRFQKKPLAFCGHTHRPAIWRRDKKGKVRTVSLKKPLVLDPACHYLINVGSVGQPRNLSNKASYVVYHPAHKRIEFRAVPYDFRTTQRKILEAGLPHFLALRLELGR